MKRSVNFSGMGGKHGRYANSVQGLVDAMRAVGYTDAEIRAELVKMQAAREAAAPSGATVPEQAAGGAAVSAKREPGQGSADLGG